MKFRPVNIHFISWGTVLCTAFFAQSTLDFTTYQQAVKSRNVMKCVPHHKQHAKKIKEYFICVSHHTLSSA